MALPSRQAPTQRPDWCPVEEAARAPCHAAAWVPELMEWMAINGAEGVSGEGASVKVVQQPPWEWEWAAAAMPSGRHKGGAVGQSGQSGKYGEAQGCCRPSMGLAAARPLQQGDVILRIPLALTMCTCRVRTPPDTSLHPWHTGTAASEPRPLEDRGPPRPGADSGGVPEVYPHSGDPAWEEWEGLTALAAWILREEARGRESSWGPYLASLPCHVALPAFAPDSLLDTLQDSDVASKARVLRRTYENEYAKCCAHQGGRAIAGASKEEFLRACALVSSRAFAGPQPQCSLLAPLTDLLNHSQQYNATWKISSSEFVLTATAEVAAGEEVCVSYGSKCSTSLLLCYGFCPGPAAGAANAFDCVPLCRGTPDLLAHFSRTFFPGDFTEEDCALAQEVVAQVDEEVRGAVETFRVVLLGETRPAGESSQEHRCSEESSAEPQPLRDSSAEHRPLGESDQEHASAGTEGCSVQGVGGGTPIRERDERETGTDMDPGTNWKLGTHHMDTGANMDRGADVSEPHGAACSPRQAGRRAVTYAQMLSASMYGPQFVLSPLPQGAGEGVGSAGEGTEGELQGRPFLVWPQGCLDPRILAACAALWHLFVHGQEADTGELARASIIYSWRMVAAMGVPLLRPALSETELGALRAAMGAVASWTRGRLSRVGTRASRQILKKLDSEEATIAPELWARHGALRTGQGARGALGRGEQATVLVPRRARVTAPSTALPDQGSPLHSRDRALACRDRAAVECASSFAQHRLCKRLLLRDLEHRLCSSLTS